MSRGAAAALGMALCTSLAPGLARAESLALTGATLIDGTDRGPIANAVVVIEAGRIVCAGAAAACPVPAGARRMAVGGQWITPGLFDTHAHLTLGKAPRNLDEQALRFARGITTTRDAGGELVTPMLEEKQRAAANSVPRPRLLVAARITEDNYAALTPGQHDLDGLVLALKARGVDAIKLKDQADAPSAVAVVQAAERHGLPSFGHTWAGPPETVFQREALAAGLDGVSHMEAFPLLALEDPALLKGDPGHDDGDRFWRWRKGLWEHTGEAKLDAASDELVQRGVWLEPLLTHDYHFGHPLLAPPALYFLDPIAPTLRSELRARFTHHDAPTFAGPYARAARFLARFHARGGLLITGGDNKEVGWDVMEEVFLLRQAGLSPLAALQCATRDAARALGRGAELGTLEPGKLADLVVFRADPLGARENLAEVAWVLKGGVVYNANKLTAPFRARHAEELKLVRQGRQMELGVLALLALLPTYVLWRLSRRPRARRPS